MSGRILKIDAQNRVYFCDQISKYIPHNYLKGRFFMLRFSVLTIIFLPSLYGCGVSYIQKSDIVKAPIRSNAFGPYPEHDKMECKALTRKEANILYPNIAKAERCNPNSHHHHDQNHRKPDHQQGA